MPNTSLGFPYPAFTDATAVPVHIQALAQSANAWLVGNVFPTQYIRVGRSDTDPYTCPGDGAMHTVGTWPDGVLRQYGTISYAGSGSIKVPVDGEYGFSWTGSWPATGSGSPQHRRVQMIIRNGAEDGRFSGKTMMLLPAGGNDHQYITANGQIRCSANDLLQAAMVQSSGSAIDMTPTVFAVWREA